MQHVKINLPTKQSTYAIIVDVITSIPGVDESFLNAKGVYTLPGSNLNPVGIYTWIGKYGFISVFNLKDNAPEALIYGERIIGKICYSPRERQALENGDPSHSKILKIEVYTPELEAETLRSARYSGIPIESISFIQTLYAPNEIASDADGNMVVPNISSIEFDPKGLDNIGFHLNFFGPRIGTYKFKAFEAETFIGYYFVAHGIHDIAGMARKMGYEPAAIKNSWRIWTTYCKSKGENGSLSKEEMLLHARSLIAQSGYLYSVVIRNAGINPAKISDEESLLISNALEMSMNFHPKILLYGENNIFWDEESYLHIILRHGREFTEKAHRSKSKFSYAAKDIEDLIEGVLDKIKTEIEANFSKLPYSDFRREYAMAVEFNGDYYNLRINSDGRLETFYPLSCEEQKKNGARMEEEISSAPEASIKTQDSQSS